MAKGETTQTTVQSTAPSNKDVNPTLSKLLKGVQAQYDANPQGYYFNKSLYAGTGATTDNALSRLLSASNNNEYRSAVQGGLNYDNNLIASGGFGSGMDGDLSTTRGVGSQYGTMAAQAANPSLSESQLMDVALGKRFGEEDPGYSRLRSNLINDVTTNDLTAFNNSGMFGSDSNRKSLAKGLGDSLAGLDYANHQNDIARQERALASIEGTRQQGFNNRMGALGAQLGAAQSAFGMGQQGVNNAMAAQSALPGMYDALLQPGKTALTVGQMYDADAQAARQADADLYMRKKGAPTDYLAKLSSILAGNAGTGGTNSTTTTPIQQPNPLQLLLGGGLGLAALL